MASRQIRKSSRPGWCSKCRTGKPPPWERPERRWCCPPDAACGTGASAVLVACVLNNLTDNLVNIHLQGGTLTIEWNKQNNHVYMEGPANIVYEGII